MHDISYQKSYMSLYKENTNVFSYYILKSILMSNYDGFMKWCFDSNMNFISFKKQIKSKKIYRLCIDSNKHAVKL